MNLHTRWHKLAESRGFESIKAMIEYDYPRNNSGQLEKLYKSTYKTIIKLIRHYDIPPKKKLRSRMLGIPKRKSRNNGKNGRQCLTCGTDLHVNYFYCSNCHAKLTEFNGINIGGDNVAVSGHE